MELILQRTHELNNATLGKLSIGDNFFCYTLEDKVRDKKIKHETAIPAGRYEVVINFSQKFQTQMPLLIDVPNYEGIRIHPGNTIAATSGCILVGSAIKDDRILHSRGTWENLMIWLRQFINREEIWITILDVPKPVIIESEPIVIEPTPVKSPKPIVPIEIPTVTPPIIEDKNWLQKLLQILINLFVKHE